MKERSARRGSSASDSQIWHAVKNERAVSFRVFSEAEPTNGWVMGADDYHWVVVTAPLIEVVLIHKSCPEVRITGQTIDSLNEVTREAVHKHTSAFREFVMREHFGHQPARLSATN